MEINKTTFEKLLKQIKNTHSSHLNAIGALESYIFHSVTFEFSIDYMPGDGFLLLDSENSRVAPVEKVFQIIEENGKITQKDMERISI